MKDDIGAHMADTSKSGSWSSRRSILTGLGASALGLGIASCSGNHATVADINSRGSAEAASWLAAEPARGVLRVAAPVGYASDALSAMFEKQSGFKLAATAPADSDIIIAGHEEIDSLALAGGLLALDAAKLGNAAAVDAGLLHGRFMSSPRFALPFAWAATGLGFRRAKISMLPESWGVVYASALYGKRTGIRADPAELIRHGAKYLGQSANGLTAETASRAAALIVEQRRRYGTEVAPTVGHRLLAGDLDVVVTDSAEMTSLHRRDVDLGFIVPREGGLLTAHLLGISVRTRQPNVAHAFLNFLLSQTVSADLGSTLGLTPSSAAARNVLSASSDRVFVPEPSTLYRSEYTIAPDPAQRLLLNRAGAVAVA